MSVFEKLSIRFARYRRVRLPRRIKRLKIMSRHPFSVPLITFGVLLLITGGGYLLARQTDRLPTEHDAKIVIISYDNQKRIVPSKARTVGSLLEKLNIRIRQGDVVEPAIESTIDQDDYRINIYRAVPVQIVDGNKRSFAYSAAKTPRSVASQAGKELYPEDTVDTDPVQDFVKTGALGEQIVIDRAVPVKVDLYGAKVTLRTHAETVAELMKEKGIKLSKHDRVSVPLDTVITPNKKIAFLRTGKRVQTRTEKIAMPIKTITDGNLAYGTTAVRQQGSAGEQVVTYEVQIVNNVVKSRKVVQKVVSRQPVTKIVAVGSSLSGIKGDMSRAGIAPGDFRYVDYIVSQESGWNPQASNPSGAYGLCQALPGSKMSSAGSDWATNPITQLRWCNGYARGTYGSWSAAYSFWISNHYW